MSTIERLRDEILVAKSAGLSQMAVFVDEAEALLAVAEAAKRVSLDAHPTSSDYSRLNTAITRLTTLDKTP